METNQPVPASLVRKVFPWAARGLAGVLCLVLALSLWNAVSSKWQHYRNPPSGRFYIVEGQEMHIDCSGAGSPTVIMEAAASAPWSEWRRVQPELSQVTQTCSYDRAGHGWSVPRKGSRDAETIIRELHSLLDQAGVKPPFVLAGHSAGGLYVREYAREFPNEVVGVALIESSSPQQIDELPGFRAAYEEDKQEAKWEVWKDRVRVWTGWERLLGHCHVPAKDFPGWSAQYDAMACRLDYVDTDECELNYFEQSSKQAGRLNTFDRKPLLVISRDPGQRGGLSARSLAAIPVWDREQEVSKSLSPQSWRVIARNSGHMVPHDRPDVVVAELTHLIDYLRGGPTPPFGTTTTR
jgi:pimeloyl-ACP methyl ester carboxylesterase